MVFFALLVLSAWANAQPQSYSYSPPAGTGGGNPYTINGEGRITAVRVWDNYNGHIYGIQLRYGYIWSHVAGYTTSDRHDIELFEDESIIQISGKFAHYVQSLVITTSRGRTLMAGQPNGRSFNMYTTNTAAELRFLSGRYHGGLTSIGAHWAIFEPFTNSTAEH